MKRLEPGRLEIKLGEYATGGSSALADPLLLGRVQDYRRLTAARMMPLETTEVKKRLPTSDYHVSRKVDGEFNVLVFDGGEVCTVNPGGTVRVGLPMLAEAASQLKKAGINRAAIAGELHFVRPDGKRPRVHDVSRAARTPDSPADLDGLHFAAFDLIELNGAAPSAQFPLTWKQINDLFGKGQRCKPVEAVTAQDVAEVEKQIAKWIGQGAEGAVVRSDAAGIFKVKPRHTIDAVVIGFTEGTEDRQGLLHDLLLGLMRPDGSIHVLGRVGGGFTEADRRNFLSDLKDMVVDSEYAEVNDQVAYRMVRPEWVIEVSVLDLIAQTTRGAPINRMVLNWNSGAPKFEVLRRLPLVAMISPQFVRRREDKSVNPSDVRLQQVSDLVEIPFIEQDARQLHLPTSTVLRREVYTKVMKGQTMVRKLLMWQTNKQKDGEDYPAYVVHYTDFSPNRKTPLEREVRVSSAREQIDQLWQGLADENVKKGWELISKSVPTPTSAPIPTAAPAPEPAPALPPAATNGHTEPAAPKAAKTAKPKAVEPPPAPAEPTPAAEADAAPAKKPRTRKKSTKE